MNIKQGNWFIGIYTYSFGKIGYPLNMFYPWITLLPFALIKVITNSTFGTVPCQVYTLNNKN